MDTEKVKQCEENKRRVCILFILIEKHYTVPFDRTFIESKQKALKATGVLKEG